MDPNQDRISNQKNKTKKKLRTIVDTVVLASLLGYSQIKYDMTNRIKHQATFTERQYLDVKTSKDVILQQNYLEEIIKKGDYKDLEDLQEINPEWGLFTLSFSTYALTNIAFHDETKREKNKETIDLAIQKALNEKITSFNDFKGFPITEKDVHEKAILLGHLNLMLDCYKLLGGEDKYDDIHKNITENLALVMKKSPTHHIESYYGGIWPADNSVIAASISLYDLINKTGYAKESSDLWKNWIHENFIDKKTGLVESQISPIDHRSMDKPRGCALGWMIQFLSLYDEKFAKEQYDSFKKHMYDPLLGISMFREFDKDTNTGFIQGDIDSGPIIIGRGVAASGFGLGAAKSQNDEEIFLSLANLAERFGVPKKTDKIKQYGPFSPLSDALILFGQTATKWDTRYIKN